jgi:hypothetical protein
LPGCSLSQPTGRNLTTETVSNRSRGPAGNPLSAAARDMAPSARLPLAANLRRKVNYICGLRLRVIPHIWHHLSSLATKGVFGRASSMVSAAPLPRTSNVLAASGRPVIRHRRGLHDTQGLSQPRKNLLSLLTSLWCEDVPGCNPMSEQNTATIMETQIQTSAL